MELLKGAIGSTGIGFDVLVAIALALSRYRPGPGDVRCSMWRCPIRNDRNSPECRTGGPYLPRRAQGGGGVDLGMDLPNVALTSRQLL